MTLSYVTQNSVTYHTYNNILEMVKFGIGDLYVMPLTINVIYEKSCSKIHIVLNGVKNFVTIIGMGDPPSLLLSNCELPENLCSKSRGTEYVPRAKENTIHLYIYIYIYT